MNDSFSPQPPFAKENIQMRFTADEDNEQKILIRLRSNYPNAKKKRFFNILAWEREILRPKIFSQFLLQKFWNFLRTQKEIISSLIKTC